MANANTVERYLYPGDLWFGKGKIQLRTLLGSCVSITLWHPGLNIGGMCHYLLPEDPGKGRGQLPDPRYADDAMDLFLKVIKRARTCPADYRVGLFGGGNMFTNLEQTWSVDIGLRNAATGRFLLRNYGFSIAYEDLEGKVHRQIILDLTDGTIFLRRGKDRSIILPSG
ncbi:putative chemoreceptor glutamine deamidase CheD [Gammaproteobacteria bacterium]